MAGATMTDWRDPGSEIFDMLVYSGMDEKEAEALWHKMALAHDQALAVSDAMQAVADIVVLHSAGLTAEVGHC